MPKDIILIDDGTLDTVIECDGEEHRFTQEFASMYRDPDTGELDQEAFFEDIQGMI